MHLLRHFLLNAATLLSLGLFEVALLAALVGHRNPGTYPLPANPRTTYFASCEPHRLRLTRQEVSPPSDPAFAASTSERDVLRVSRVPKGEALSGIGLRNVGEASLGGFQWVSFKMGWWCPPGSVGAFGAVHSQSVFRLDYWSASVPYWFALVSTAVLPLVAVRRQWTRRRMARRAADGRCPACGYDLRATPDRCPECGTLPSAPP
jgi:hypothetical protein